MTAARSCPVCGAAGSAPCRRMIGGKVAARHQLRDAPVGAAVEISVSLHRRLEEIARAAQVSIYVAIEWAIQQALHAGRWKAPPIVPDAVHRRLSAAAGRRRAP